MPGYHTHQQALMAAVARTTPNEPVLELGIGEYSTPLLHEICEAQGRYLRTVTQDPVWYAKYKSFHREGRHDIILLPGGRKLSTWQEGKRNLDPPPHDPRYNNDSHWEVVFVDQAPGNARVWSIEYLRPHTHIFVVHDAEEREHYGYGPIFDSFPHRKLYKRLKPHTILLSDWEPFTHW